MVRTHPLPSFLQSIDAILLVSPHLRSLMKSSRVNLSSRLLSAPTSYQGYVSTQLSCLNFGPLQNLKAATVIDVRIRAGAGKFQLHRRCSSRHRHGEFMQHAIARNNSTYVYTNLVSTWRAHSRRKHAFVISVCMHSFLVRTVISILCRKVQVLVDLSMRV